jgi:hypothetical protein
MSSICGRRFRQPQASITRLPSPPLSWNHTAEPLDLVICFERPKRSGSKPIASLICPPKNSLSYSAMRNSKSTEWFRVKLRCTSMCFLRRRDLTGRVGVVKSIDGRLICAYCDAGSAIGSRFGQNLMKLLCFRLVKQASCRRVNSAARRQIKCAAFPIEAGYRLSWT